MKWSWQRTEYALLVALCVFLPLYEAPKNILWLLYLVVWTVNRARARDFGGPWDLWDTLIAVWVASGFAVAAFAGLHGAEWHGTVDLVRYGVLLFAVRRTRYSVAELRGVLAALVVATLWGLGEGYWRVWNGTAHDLQLNSVGHVNHTSIYLAIMFGACVSALFAGWRPALAGAAALVLLVSVFVTESRATVLASLALLPLLGAGWWPRSRVPLVVSCVAALLAVAAAVVGGADVIAKHLKDVKANNMLAFRGGIWRTGLAAFERFPLFGVGMDNYSLIEKSEVKAWRLEDGENYDPKLYLPGSHGHSLVVTTLAERGLVGAGALAAVLLAWLVWLARHRPRADDPPELPALWGCAASAWVISVVVGLANTTLHDEHAILSVLFLGLWLSRLKRPSR